MNRFCRLLLTCWLALWMPCGLAADSGWLQNPDNPHAKVRLRADNPTPGNTRLLLDIRLASGWKTYWRSPGEAGVASSIHWQGDVNARWYWPTPEHFTLAGIATQGYQHEVSLPIEISGQVPQPLAGVLTIATCRDVCLLTDYPFSLNITPANHGTPHNPTAGNPTFDYDFTRAMGQVPLDHGLTDNVTASFQPGLLTISAHRAAGWHHPTLFLDDVAHADFASPRVQVQGETMHATIAVQRLGNSPAVDLRGKNLSLVLTDAGLAQQTHVTVSDTPQAGTGRQSPPLWRVLLLALAGGFILNLMPCVLPVLAMKLTSILHSQGRQRRQIRVQFIASSGGILLSFLLLALLMSVLRLAGSIPGWGVQFQSPWFIGFMALVMWIFSANLFGLFEVNLPSRLATRLANQRGNGIASHVWQGVFATLLATPCSAPFLGTALAVALAAPFAVLWVTFIALAVGMSLPWLAVAAWPGLVLWLPKPGRWMLWLRLALGLLMLLSGLWLVSLLANHFGFITSQLLAAAGTLLLLAMAGWRYGWRPAAGVTGVLLLLVAAGVFSGVLHFSAPSARAQSAIHWQPLSEQAIQQALAEHKRVFVDVTADWCVTCKANEYNVLSQKDIQALLNAPDVVALRGDWSTPSAKISEFLKQRGSVAVPFNQVYGPALPEGEILPVLLTRQGMIQALTTAKGKP